MGITYQMVGGRRKRLKERRAKMESNLARLVSMLPDRPLRRGEKIQFARELNVHPETIRRYLKQIEAMSICPCCKQKITVPPPSEKMHDLDV